MSNVFDYKDEKIHIKFPTAKFGKYLAMVHAQSVDELSFGQTRKLFLLVVDDFKSGKLSLDDMSEIAQTLWKQLLRDGSDGAKELKDVLNNATELNFYVRRIPELEPDGKTFVFFMTSVVAYFEKNKKVSG